MKSILLLAILTLNAQAGGGDETDSYIWCQETCWNRASQDANFENESCWDSCHSLKQFSCRWADEFPQGTFDLHATAKPFQLPEKASLSRCDLEEHVDYGYQCSSKNYTSWSDFQLDQASFYGRGGRLGGASQLHGGLRVDIHLNRDVAGDVMYKMKRNYKGEATVEIRGLRKTYPVRCGAYYK